MSQATEKISSVNSNMHAGKKFVGHKQRAPGCARNMNDLPGDFREKGGEVTKWAVADRGADLRCQVLQDWRGAVFLKKDEKSP